MFIDGHPISINQQELDQMSGYQFSNINKGLWAIYTFQ